MRRWFIDSTVVLGPESDRKSQTEIKRSGNHQAQLVAHFHELKNYCNSQGYSKTNLAFAFSSHWLAILSHKMMALLVCA